LWQRPVGPAWSSFSLAGRRLFSQEQRGESEHVVCYDTETGEEIWTHANPARFYEVMAGVGPRATPTYHQGRIYALGATGLLDCLDASTGTPIWSRDLRTDADRDTPLWGFASSPLVVGSVVLVHAGGQGDRGVMAYHLKTGELAWSAPAGTLSYSSPHLWQAQGQAQVLMSSDAGLVSLAPDTGQTLWNHAWQTQGNPRIVQPHPVAENRVLLGTGVGYGTRLLSVLQLDGGWQVTEVWTSEKLKPYFNDFVVHQGAIYGFDGKILTCIDLETGARNWKGGRYGAGQLILLEASDLLLVISDKGEVVLVDADPTAHRERTRFQALLGKTWNHPVVSGGRLYVRNAVEAAGYDLFP
jgi:outer membrane protein assembly factor BamB